MPQSICTLNGYRFPYNPYPAQYPFKRGSQYQPALSGGYVTDFGYIVQDTLLALEWMVMERAFYLQLLALFVAASAQYTFVDPYGTSMTVFIETLEPKSLLAGGDDAIEGVKMMLRVLSIP